MSKIEWAGYHADDANPYSQTTILGESGLAIAATGGGGGASQLLPATVLQPLIGEAMRAITSPRDASFLVQLFGAIDEAVGRLVAQPMYVGSSAQLVAACESNNTVWVGAVGRCRAWHVTPNAIACITRDDSLLQDFLETHPTQEEIARFPYHRGIITASMNGKWRAIRPDWTPSAVALRESEGLLLTTSESHTHFSEPELLRWTLEALAMPKLDLGVMTLWSRLRDHVNALPNHEQAVNDFDRNFAVVLLRSTNKT